MIKLKDLLEMSGVKGMKWRRQPEIDPNIPGIRGKHRQYSAGEPISDTDYFATDMGMWDDEFEDKSGDILNKHWDKLNDTQKVLHLNNYSDDLDQYLYHNAGFDTEFHPSEIADYKERNKARAMSREIFKRGNIEYEDRKKLKHDFGHIHGPNYGWKPPKHTTYGVPVDWDSDNPFQIESYNSNQKGRLNEWTKKPPKEKRWSGAFGARDGLTEFERRGGKDTINEVGAAPQHKKFIKNIYKAEENMHKHIMLYKNFLNSQGLKKEANEIGSKYVGIVGKFTHWMKITWNKMVRKMI